MKIAGRWFPRGLLIDVGQGQLNLAEAALDVAQGEPQPTSALLKDVELPSGINPKLAEFSLNRALQDDARFDEVGPGGSKYCGVCGASSPTAFARSRNSCDTQTLSTIPRRWMLRCGASRPSWTTS